MGLMQRSNKNKLAVHFYAISGMYKNMLSERYSPDSYYVILLSKALLKLMLDKSL
jgi:hypothetical protein